MGRAQRNPSSPKQGGCPNGYDARAGGNAVERFISGKDFDDYLADEMLRSTVERQFEILGEALAQRSRADPKLAAQIPDAGNAIGFRNVRIRG